MQKCLLNFMNQIQELILKEDKKVSWGDIAWSNMYSIEALMNTLEKKGLITKQEVLEELQKLKDGHEKRIMIELNMI